MRCARFMLSNSNLPEFKVVVLNPKEANGASGKSTLSSRIREALLGAVLDWYHFSLLRQVLRESRNAVYRIFLPRCRWTVLNFADVEQSLPDVSLEDSQNQMQFCTASIQKLSEERPYLTLVDMRLVVEGFLLADKWFLRTDTECRTEQQDSYFQIPEARQVYAAPSSSTIDQT
jgi:hypothetical protein